MAKRGRPRAGQAGCEAGLLELTFTQLWQLAEALRMKPSELARRIDPAVRRAQRERR